MSDLISRQAAINAIKRYESADSYDINEGLIMAMNAVADVPTIDPVKRGEWVGTEFDGYADGYPVFYEWACSNCGCVFEDDEPTYYYCPNCGARMDGEE